MNVLIATPTTQGKVTSGYAHSLVAAIAALGRLGGSFRLTTLDGVSVVMARNTIAHAFLADPALTHLFFLDSDMLVDREVMHHLLALGKPIAGAIYQTRDIDLDAFASAIAEGHDRRHAAALASAFTVRMAPGTIEIRQGMIEVEGFGFGCVLIAREVFQKLIARGSVTARSDSRYARLGAQGPVHGFFDEIVATNGESLGEDYSFCARVKQLGDVPLLAYIGPGVKHIGPFTFDAAFLDQLTAHSRIAPAGAASDPT